MHAAPAYVGKLYQSRLPWLTACRLPLRASNLMTWLASAACALLMINSHALQSKAGVTLLGRAPAFGSCRRGACPCAWALQAWSMLCYIPVWRLGSAGCAWFEQRMFCGFSVKPQLPCPFRVASDQALLLDQAPWPALIMMRLEPDEMQAGAC